LDGAVDRATYYKLLQGLTRHVDPAMRQACRDRGAGESLGSLGERAVKSLLLSRNINCIDHFERERFGPASPASISRRIASGREGPSSCAAAQSTA
jgi:hypothetical protein